MAFGTRLLQHKVGVDTKNMASRISWKSRTTVLPPILASCFYSSNQQVFNRPIASIKPFVIADIDTFVTS